MILPNQRLLPQQQQTPTNPNQGVLNPQIIQALINQQQAAPNPLMQQPQQQQPQDQYQTPILDRYKQFLLDQKAPDPNDYKPSGWRRLAAGLAGVSGGIPATDYVLNAPYQRAVGAYDARAKQLGEGANVEERQVTNKRIINQNQEVNKIREESNQIRQQLGEAQNYIRQQATDIANRKEGDIKDFKYAEMAQKAADLQQKLEQQQQQYEGRRDDTAAKLELQRTQMEATKLIHQLELAQKDRQIAETQRLHDELKKKWEGESADRARKLDQSGQPTVTTSSHTDASGKTETMTKTTQKGKSTPPTTNEGTIKVRRKSDGQTGTIGISKFDDKLYERVQ